MTIERSDSGAIRPAAVRRCWANAMTLSHNSSLVVDRGRNFPRARHPCRENQFPAGDDMLVNLNEVRTESERLEARPQLADPCRPMLARLTPAPRESVKMDKFWTVTAGYGKAVRE